MSLNPTLWGSCGSTDTTTILRKNRLGYSFVYDAQGMYS